MIKRSFNFRLPVRTQKLYRSVLTNCLIQVVIVFQCFFGFASAAEQQIGQKVQSKPFMFMEVLPHGNLAISSLVDGIHSFLNGVVEFVDTTLSFYQKPGRGGDENGDNGDDKSETHLIVISVLLCLWSAIHCKYSKHKEDP